MKQIELALQSVDGYLLSISRNALDGWYELEVGLPNNWVYDGNNKISCEVIDKTDAGVLLKVSPKNKYIAVDDLVLFVEMIIETNKKIVEKEKQFTDKMQEMKSMLEAEAKKFYLEVDELKANSFNTNNSNFEKSLHPEEDDKSVKKTSRKKEKSDAAQVTSHDVSLTEKSSSIKE